MKIFKSKKEIQVAGEKLLAGNLKNFISPAQISCVRAGLKGEEQSFFADKMMELSARIEKMPKSYETEKQKEKTVFLHYFRGNMDWYIVEKDAGSADDAPEEKGKQFQAFGFANIGWGFEMGYVSIQELIENNIELDFYFTPKIFSEVKK